VVRISAENAPEAFTETILALRMSGVGGTSRNGPVISIPTPTMLEVRNPLERVVFDPVRDCNHFFHVMETVWMFAGENKVDWLEQFNKGYRKYAEDDGWIHGAYGHRWRRRFSKDQILTVIDMLKKDHNDRRAVLAMWDAKSDLGEARRDVPCNTHIYLRIVAGRLDMLVCNRSNDAIWGMAGANIVHMTYLQELIAFGLGIPVGIYRVITNNLHIYTQMPKFEQLWCPNPIADPYARKVDPWPLLQEHETVEDLLSDCYLLATDRDTGYLRTQWALAVALPMMQAYLKPERRNEYIESIAASDWRLACQQWHDRRQQDKL
jgi:hypothetical protein